ncbi:hypothetical protein FKM82_020764 [Ascaphus truei]
MRDISHVSQAHPGPESATATSPPEQVPPLHLLLSLTQARTDHSQQMQDSFSQCCLAGRHYNHRRVY